MSKNKVLLEDRETEYLKKQLKTCKTLKILFIIFGIVFILGGATMFFFGFAYVLGGVLGVVLTLGYGDPSELFALGTALYLSGIFVIVIGLVMLIAGTIVTSVKIRNRRAILDLRGDFE